VAVLAGGRAGVRGAHRPGGEQGWAHDEDATPAGAQPPQPADIDHLLAQYGCGPIRFTGTSDALYERHLMFDNVVDVAASGARERYEAVARSVRDVLSQRWLRTEQIYERENPKRIYYLSM
jgi:starch phosphorylase